MSAKLGWLLVIGMLSLPAAALAQTDASPGWHTAPDKWKEPRIYQSAFDPQYESRIRFGEAPSRELPDQFRSPNGAYWLALDQPDTTRPGPWNTTLCLFTERDTLQTLTFLDHATYGVTAAWINEKLVTVRVWWGRELGTDLILDAETRAVIWREMFRYGQSVFQQYQEHAAAGTPVGPEEPPAPASGQAGSGLPPRLPLAAAVPLGERFAAGKGVDLRGQHLHSARLQYDAKNRKQYFWLLVWAWDQARLGGEYGLWVYMDGTVDEHRLGP
jgi:hypothetical protein